VNRLQDIPNIDGYEFIGVTNDGKKSCRVARDNETGLHYVEGEAKYCDLIGWYNANEDIK